VRGCGLLLNTQKLPYAFPSVHVISASVHLLHIQLLLLSKVITITDTRCRAINLIIFKHFDKCIEIIVLGYDDEE